MVDKTTDTQSVLDQLVKGVTDRKTPLTPIGEEAKGPAYVKPNDPGVLVPRGSEGSYMEQNLREAKEILAVAREEIDRGMALIDRALKNAGVIAADPESLSRVKDLPAPPPVSPPSDDFAASFAAKAAAAQAATFTNTDAKASGLWLCPTHGSASERTSKKGRKYRACDECSDFERA